MVKRVSCAANQRAHVSEPSSEPSSTSTHCQRGSVCRCRLHRQAGNVAAAFQTGNSMEMSGGTTVVLEHAVTHRSYRHNFPGGAPVLWSCLGATGIRRPVDW